jgi:hypothetical protein
VQAGKGSNRRYGQWQLVSRYDLHDSAGMQSDSQRRSGLDSLKISGRGSS